jgi:uncharacterized DUF497 family protein
MSPILENCEGFDWDEGNSNKNWHRHRVTDGECEEVFFNFPLIVANDRDHSGKENRFAALGRTDDHRRLFIAFAIRRSLVRIISARDMNKNENRRYEEEIKRNA